LNDESMVSVDYPSKRRDFAYHVQSASLSLDITSDTLTRLTCNKRAEALDFDKSDTDLLLLFLVP